MKITVDKLKGLEKKMHVVIPAADFDSAINKKFNEVVKTISLPGFRKGKIPANIVHGRYDGAILGEVTQDLISSSLQNALKDKDCMPVAVPRVDVKKSEKGSNLEYEAVFEEYPKIETLDLSKCKVTVPETDVTEKDIDAAVESIRGQKTTWEVADAKSVKGNQVTVDFVGTVDDVEFEGGSANDFKVVLGSGSVLPEFDKALTGVKAGDSKKAKVPFPKDYHSERLAGKKAVFSLEVKEVAAPVLPEVNEEFIKNFGVESGTEKDFREQVKQPLETEVGRLVSDLKQSRVFEMLEKQYKKVLVPNALVAEEIKSAIKNTPNAESNKELQDIKPGDKHVIAENSQRKVFLSLICQHLLYDYKIELDNDKFESYVKSLAGSYMQEAEFMQWFHSDKARVEQVKATVLQIQLIDAVLEKSTVKVEKIDFEKLRKTVNG